jgi:hypothetical protein
MTESFYEDIKEMFRLDTPAKEERFLDVLLLEGARMEREGLIETIHTPFGDLRVLKHPLLSKEEK